MVSRHDPQRLREMQGQAADALVAARPEKGFQKKMSLPPNFHYPKSRIYQGMTDIGAEKGSLFWNIGGARAKVQSAKPLYIIENKLLS